MNIIRIDSRITQEYLHDVFTYNENTGEFKRRKSTTQSTGYIHHSGYKAIKLFSKAYQLHNVIWLYTYGEWPKLEIDHINGIRDDNRISNLRDVTRSVNVQSSWDRIPVHNRRNPNVSASNRRRSKQ